MILDAAGRPIDQAPTSSSPSSCPTCGAPAAELQAAGSFGGYSEVVCLKCGETITRRREG